MKKILIIAYYFPPCTLTPAQRMFSWAKYFHKFGYYPVIVTRNWDLPIENQSQVDIPVGEKIIHEQKDTYEVYYLPFNGNFRTKIYQRLKQTRFAFVSKFFTVAELILQNFWFSITPYSNFYDFTSSYLKKNKDIALVLISANPFILFKLGYEIKKQFGIPWLADYRDDWTTHEMNLNSFVKIKLWYESFFEKKWVRSAAIVTGVSNFYASKTAGLLKKECHVIENGYFEENYVDKDSVVPYDEYTIVYNGTLYPDQPIEPFLEAYKKVIDLYKEQAKIKLLFLGLAFDKGQALRINNNLKGYENHYRITERMPNKAVIDIQLRAHLLLMVSYGQAKGIPGSKLYEYVASEKPVLVCPTDHEVIEETLTKTGQGIICNNSSEAYSALKDRIETFLKTGTGNNNDMQVDRVAVKSYSRFNQCKRLADLIGSKLGN